MLNTMLSNTPIQNVKSYYFPHEINQSNIQNNNYQNLYVPLKKKSKHIYNQYNTTMEQNNAISIINSSFYSSKGLELIPKNIKNNETKKKRIAKNIFTIEEDKTLIELQSIYKDDWKKISESMPNRTIRQCKERYQHYLSPEISLSQWTEEEDDLLDQKVQEIGKRWKIMEKFFPGRTEISIRNRWNMIERKKKREMRKQIKKLTLKKIDIPKSLNYQSNSKINNTEFFLSTNDKQTKSDNLSFPENSALPNPFNESINTFNDKPNKINFEDIFQNEIFREDLAFEKIFDADLNFENDTLNL